MVKSPCKTSKTDLNDPSSVTNPAIFDVTPRAGGIVTEFGSNKEKCKCKSNKR